MMSSSLPELLCRRFLLDEIASSTNNFDDNLVIGRGGFGMVYKGILDHGASIVAIKRLNPSSKQGAPEFRAEINMLSKFRHSHLVSLIGYCDGNNEMVLVYDYMINGTLADHIYKNRKNDKDSLPLSWVQRLKICIGAARGLDYLHTGTAIFERVIHRDVKSTNILLDENWAAKISDFGLSRTGPADQDCTDVATEHIKGTFGYMDPDYFLTRRFTRKTDVYAFGVVLLEVLSERPAVDRSLPNVDQWGLAGWGQQCINEGAPHKLIGPNVDWEILQTSLMEFVQIASQCLHSRPKKRPTMSEVVAKLELALALQLRTNELMDDDLLGNDWPFGSPKKTESFSNSNQILQGEDSSSEHLFQCETPEVLGAFNSKITDSYTKDNPTEHVDDCGSKHLEMPVVLEYSAAKTSSNDNRGHNSKSLDKVGDVIEYVAITSGEIGTPNLRKFKFSELESATKNFTLHVWGDGIGRVYIGWVDEKTLLPSGIGGKTVAVKISHQGPAKEMMEVELEILGRLSQPNFVKLLGYCYDDDDGLLINSGEKENDRRFCLVYEYMQNGSLDEHLFGNFRCPLSWNRRLKIAIGTARALSFLHATTDNQVIVRDIRTSKILLNEDFDAKLSGFGLAKKYPLNGDTHISTKVMGAYGYAAPEYLATGHLRLESDVYSFGVVLLELLTGLRAIDDKRQQGMQNLVLWAKPILSHKASVKHRIMDRRLETDCPSKNVLELASLIQKCLEYLPKLLPSMEQVLLSLEQINSIENREAQADTSKSFWPWTHISRKTDS